MDAQSPTVVGKEQLLQLLEQLKPLFPLSLKVLLYHVLWNDV